MYVVHGLWGLSSIWKQVWQNRRVSIIVDRKQKKENAGRGQRMTQPEETIRTPLPSYGLPRRRNADAAGRQGLAVAAQDPNPTAAAAAQSRVTLAATSLS